MIIILLYIEVIPLWLKFFGVLFLGLRYVTAKNGITEMKLYAVICNYGPSSMSGHFIAYCRHRINQKRNKSNDSKVT